MKEYAVTIATRDPDHPLVPLVHLEFGVPVNEPRALMDALGAVLGMLQTHVTPEEVVRFMKQNAALAKLKTLVKG